MVALLVLTRCYVKKVWTNRRRTWSISVEKILPEIFVFVKEWNAQSCQWGQRDLTFFGRQLEEITKIRQVSVKDRWCVWNPSVASSPLSQLLVLSHEGQILDTGTSFQFSVLKSRNLTENIRSSVSWPKENTSACPNHYWAWFSKSRRLGSYKNPRSSVFSRLTVGNFKHWVLLGFWSMSVPAASVLCMRVSRCQPDTP